MQKYKPGHSISDKRRTTDVLTEEQVDFESLLLSSALVQGLRDAGFEKPSPIQLKAIPLGKCGLDLIAQAKSGTGKTCVFSVIALENIITESNCVQVLILAPTREIAVQIKDVINAIGCHFESLGCSAFIGGLSVEDDRKALKTCHVAVGTPGRVKYLIENKLLKTDSVRMFILDEADKLLDNSFQEQINWIFWSLPENKQMMAFSATYPEYLANHLQRYMREPTFVRLNAADPALQGIKQFYSPVPFHPLPHKTFQEKVDKLITLLMSVNFNQCLVFSNYQIRAQSLSDTLCSKGWPATFIAGSQTQATRLKAMEQLKKFQCRILISTDLTARGIDAENVNLVVNMDVPYNGETYLHRIGRAGRFGTQGVAVTYVAKGKEEQGLRDIESSIGIIMDLLPDHVPDTLLECNKLPFGSEVKDGSNEVEIGIIKNDKKAWKLCVDENAEQTELPSGEEDINSNSTTRHDGTGKLKPHDASNHNHHSPLDNPAIHVEVFAHTMYKTDKESSKCKGSCTNNQDMMDTAVVGKVANFNETTNDQDLKAREGAYLETSLNSEDDLHKCTTGRKQNENSYLCLGKISIVEYTDLQDLHGAGLASDSGTANNGISPSSCAQGKWDSSPTFIDDFEKDFEEYLSISGLCGGSEEKQLQDNVEGAEEDVTFSLPSAEEFDKDFEEYLEMTGNLATHAINLNCLVSEQNGSKNETSSDELDYNDPPYWKNKDSGTDDSHVLAEQSDDKILYEHTAEVEPEFVYDRPHKVAEVCVSQTHSIASNGIHAVDEHRAYRKDEESGDEDSYSSSDNMSVNSCNKANDNADHSTDHYREEFNEEEPVHHQEIHANQTEMHSKACNSYQIENAATQQQQHKYHDSTVSDNCSSRENNKIISAYYDSSCQSNNASEGAYDGLHNTYAGQYRSDNGNPATYPLHSYWWNNNTYNNNGYQSSHPTGHELHFNGHEAHYPGGESHYPGGESHYSGHESHYPGHESHYPGHKSHYLGGESHHPCGESYYPGGESYYSGQRLQYTGHGAYNPRYGTYHTEHESHYQGGEYTGHEISNPRHGAYYHGEASHSLGSGLYSHGYGMFYHSPRPYYQGIEGSQATRQVCLRNEQWVKAWNDAYTNLTNLVYQFCQLT